MEPPNWLGGSLLFRNSVQSAYRFSCEKIVRNRFMLPSEIASNCEAISGFCIESYPEASARNEARKRTVGMGIMGIRGIMIRSPLFPLLLLLPSIPSSPISLPCFRHVDANHMFARRRLRDRWAHLSRSHEFCDRFQSEENLGHLCDLW